MQESIIIRDYNTHCTYQVLQNMDYSSLRIQHQPPHTANAEAGVCKNLRLKYDVRYDALKSRVVDVLETRKFRRPIINAQLYQLHLVARAVGTGRGAHDAVGLHLRDDTHPLTNQHAVTRPDADVCTPDSDVGTSRPRPHTGVSGWTV